MCALAMSFEYGMTWHDMAMMMISIDFISFHFFIHCRSISLGGYELVDLSHSGEMMYQLRILIRSKVRTVLPNRTSTVTVLITSVLILEYLFICSFVHLCC